MASTTQGVICLQNVLVQGERITCLVLATENLNKNVACNLSIVLFMPCIMLMQFFSYLQPQFKQVKTKCGQFSVFTETPSRYHSMHLLIIFIISLFSLLIFLIPGPLLRFVGSLSKQGSRSPTVRMLHCSSFPFLTTTHRTVSRVLDMNMTKPLRYTYYSIRTFDIKPKKYSIRNMLPENKIDNVYWL